jgi:hypothetical protein
VLPVTALQSEYIVQTYEGIKQDIIYDGEEGGKDNGFNGVKQNVFTILAAEDCTVDITPAGKTVGGKTTTFSVDLKAGQNYHVLSAENVNLSGSRVKARNEKKIAVFAGAPLTRVPNCFSDRDLLYEQLFPIDYWGQNFIVSRSKQKDVNRIIITAQEDDTEVTIYGNYDLNTSKNDDHTIYQNYTFTLSAGQSYEFELSAGYESGRWDNKRSSFKGITVIDSCAYIQTSCPCAVLSYDVGNGYYRKDSGIETYKDGSKYYGAPSMTWVSPIEQMINDIVFGVMGTDNTTKHFINIIAYTSDVKNVKLNNVELTSQFKKVESNPTYSYARITLRETTPGGTNPFYHLESKYGFIATVYGNGDDESYAYSVGSSAVKRGVNIEGVKFVDNMRSEDPFCVGTTLRFDPQVSSDVIDKVVWDFGDGTSATTTKETGIVAEHTYTSPDWYDVTARISAHKSCPEASYPEEAVSFSFRVIEPEFKFGKVEHLCLDTGTAVIPANELDTLWPKDGKCEPIIYVNYIHYGKETVWYDTIPNAKDSYYEPLNGKTYSLDPTKPEDYIVDIELNVSKLTGKKNQYQCDSLIMRHVKISTCLHMTMDNTSDQHSCYGEKMDVPYTHVRGKIGDATMQLIGELAPSTPQPIVLEDGIATLPTQDLKPGEYKAKVEVKDGGCDSTLTFTIPFTVYYPSDIFVYMFDNTLAVYKAGNGGNKKLQQDFTGYTYQWYLKGEPIQGANSSVYVKQYGKFAEGDSVFVEFIDPAGYKLKSCAQILPERDFTAPEEEDDTNNAPALKLLINNRLVIRKDGQTYNMYGQRVE